MNKMRQKTLKDCIFSNLCVCVHNSKFIQKTTNCSVPGVVNFVKLYFTDISVKVNAKIFSIVFLNV